MRQVRGTVLGILGSAALVALPVTAHGGSFSLQIPELSGPVDFNPKLVQVDFGLAFAQVESVELMLTGALTPGLIELCDPAGVSCRVEVPHLYFGAFLEGAGRLPFSAFIVGDGPVQALVEFAPPSREPEATLEFLQDGAAELRIGLGPRGFIGDQILTVLEPSSGVIDSASLVLHGIPIPEPSTAWLVVVGLGAFALHARVKPRSFHSSRRLL